MAERLNGIIKALESGKPAFTTFAQPDGPPVFGLGRQPMTAPRFTEHRDGASWEALDLSEPGALEECLQRIEPSRVISCAALSRVGDCEEDPALAEHLNVVCPAQLAAWCQARGARLVHISTDLVFGAEVAPEGGFGEDAQPGPVSTYGRTKLAGERAVLEACPEALVVRLPLLYGDSAGRGLGASDSLLVAIDRGDMPRLFQDEWRTPLEVSNAAQAIAELGEGTASGCLHLAGPDRIHRYGLGLAVLMGMGLSEEEGKACVVPAERSDLPDLGIRPEDVCLNSQRARTLLQTPLLGVEEGIVQAFG